MHTRVFLVGAVAFHDGRSSLKLTGWVQWRGQAPAKRGVRPTEYFYSFDDGASEKHILSRNRNGSPALPRMIPAQQG